MSKRRNKPPVTVETNRQRLLRLRREQKLMAEGVAAFVDPDNAEAEWISKLPSRMSECGKDASFRPCWVGHLNKTWVKCCDCSICVFHQAKKSARHLLTVQRCAAVTDFPVYTVLTCSHRKGEDLGALVGDLYEGIKRLKRALKRKRFAYLDVEGVLVKHELTTGGEHGHHPHVNLMLASQPLYQEQAEGSEEGPCWDYLRAEWTKIMAKLGRVAEPHAQYCARLKSEGEIAKYLAKGDLLLYQRDQSEEDGIKKDSEGKPVPHEPYERGRIIVEVAKAYRSKRTIQGSGIFFGLEPSDEEVEEDAGSADLDNGEDEETCNVEGCSSPLKARQCKPFEEVMAEMRMHSRLRLKTKKSKLRERAEARQKARARRDLVSCSAG